MTICSFLRSLNYFTFAKFCSHSMNVIASLSEYTNHAPQGPPIVLLLFVRSHAPLNSWGYVLRGASSGDFIAM